MNSVLHDLKNLQEIDDQLRQARKILEDGSARLAEAGDRLKALENKLTLAGRELEAMRGRHRDLEGEVADLSFKKKNNEVRQMNIKSDQEYAALQREAGFLAGRINELEDETLALLDRMDARESEVAALRLAVGGETEAYDRLSVETKLALAAGRDHLAELTARREAVAAALPPAQLNRYDELIRTKGGRAVTPATGGMCQACRLGFPPQVFNELQRNEKIINCPNCGRIIFWPDHPDFRPEPSGPPQP